MQQGNKNGPKPYLLSLKEGWTNLIHGTCRCNEIKLRNRRLFDCNHLVEDRV